MVAPRADPVNVLILAFDDLSAPLAAPAAVPAASNVARPAAAAKPPRGRAVAPLPQLRAPITPAAPAVAAPEGGGAAIRPAPEAAPPREAPAIRPAALRALGGIEYRALAQQRGTGKKPPRKKKGLTDDDFRNEPIPLPPPRTQGRPPASEVDGVVSGNAAGDGAADANAGAAGAAGAAGTGGTVTGDASAGGESAPVVAPNSPFAIDRAPASGGASSILGPGRAQAVASPLRRALVRVGFGDVLAVAPGNVALTRVLEAHTLSPRVLEAARSGLAELAAVAAPTVEASAAADAAAADAGAAASTSSAADAPAPTASGLAAGAPQDRRWAALYQAASRVGQALGYRAVVVLGVAPRMSENGAAKGASFALAVVDALRETGEPIAFDEDAGTLAQANESAALTASALVTRSLNALPAVSNAEKIERSSSYMAQARAAYEAGDFASAQDYLSQVLVFEPTRAEARLLLADVLGRTDPDAAQRAYRSALTLEGVDGPSWAKAAIAFTVGTTPDWPQALASAHKALALGYDSAELQQAMATAQMGRAFLFRQADRLDKADEADADAQAHLDRALALAPDDPGPSRLMASYLVQQGRSRDAVRLLDRIALQYPDDAALQTMYANTLFDVGGRDEDAFVAWARVWHLSGQAAVPVDAAHYKRLSDGFDQRLATLGKRAAQLASSVAAGTAARETALLQMSRYKEDMDASIEAVRVMQPPYDARASTTHASRVFSADLMSQAMASYTAYLETGQEMMRERANGLQRQAILMLNAARATPN